MSKKDQENAEKTAEEAQAPADQPEAQNDAPPEGEPVAEDATAALAEEVATLKDRLMRAVAEAENVRRRGERERADAAAYAISNFARDMLTISDNLHRTIEALPENLRKEETVKSFVEGVEMTDRELIRAFEKHGIRRIEPVGEPFDHNFHQAMFEVENSGQPPGTVVQVVQAGYVIKDRLLRPAMVGVAKGPAGEASDDAKGGAVDETV